MRKVFCGACGADADLRLAYGRVAMTAQVASLSVCAFGLATLLVGCGGAHRPSKGYVAGELDCRRSGVQMSEVFEDTWQGEDGAMHLRYRVGVSCTKPKNEPVAPMDVWQECRWEDDDWSCANWQSGRGDGQGGGEEIWLNPTERGR